MCACCKSVGKKRNTKGNARSRFPQFYEVSMHQAGWVGHGIHRFHGARRRSFVPPAPHFTPSMLVMLQSLNTHRPGAGTAKGERWYTAGSPTHSWPPVCPWGPAGKFATESMGSPMQQAITDAIAIEGSREHPHLPAAKSTAPVSRASSPAKR